MLINEKGVGHVQEHAGADRRLAVVAQGRKTGCAARCSCTYAPNDYPFTEIAKAARRNKRDLIVMASHGRRGLSRLILGSETSKDLEAEYYVKKSRE